MAESLTEALSGIEGLLTPSARDDAIHSWHLYVVLIEENLFGRSRNAFIEKMKEAGVGTSVHYLPLHMHPYYIGKYGYEPEDFPIAAALFAKMASLPIYPSLTDKEIARIADAVAATKKNWR